MKTLMFLLVLMLSFSAQALRPVDGLWWNPDESGRGVFIELQDETLVLALYGYADNGENRWYISDGSYDAETGWYDGRWITFTDGQCNRCDYQSPFVDESDSMTMSVKFHSNVTATLYWGGRETPLVRQYWEFSQLNDFLYGQWTVSIEANTGIWEGDAFDLFAEYADGGIEYVDGHRLNAPGRRMLAHYDDDLQLFAALVDSSDNYYRYYLFDMTKDSMTGYHWLYPKSGYPGDEEEFFRGQRLASATYSRTGQGSFGKKQVDYSIQDRRAVTSQPGVKPGPISIDGKKVSPEQILQQAKKLQIRFEQ